VILLARPAAARILAAVEAVGGGDTSTANASTIDASLDLGRTTSTVAVEPGIVRFPDGQSLAASQLHHVVEHPDAVFAVLEDDIEKVTWFSEDTNKVYTLRATEGWPALEISGVLMHRIKDTDPRADAESKVAAIAPIRGRVLETCCGLGYSAIHVARTATHVTVFEIDPNVLEMARLNPHSAPLFEAGGRIEVVNQDITEAIRDLPDDTFDAILHDPPTLAHAGDLYGDAFYGHLLRVLRPGGRLFHYTGDPGSRHRRQDLPGRVAQRLANTGFTHVQRQPAALGVSARKP
jgi:uncharacterized protein